MDENEQKQAEAQRLIEGGGPAFPTPGEMQVVGDLGYRGNGEPGMSLRDWFAGQALAGMMTTKTASFPMQHDIAKMAAQMAYEFADAMLAERRNTTPG